MSSMVKVEVSKRSIVFTVLFLIFLFFLWMIQDLIFSLLIAFIIMSALNPLVSVLERYRVPRSLSAVVMFLLLLTGLGYLFSVIIPPIAHETAALYKNVPSYIRELNKLFGFVIPIDAGAITRLLPNVTDNAVSIVRATVSNLVFFITTIFFSLYLLIDEKIIRKFFERFYEKKDAHAIALVFDRAEIRMRDWMWGELSLMLIIGVLTYIGLIAVGASYALPLAVLAGLLEIVPIIGPIISAIPAILISLPQSGVLAISVTALYFVIQQFENQIIVPVVMKRAVGLNPIITLIVLIVGSKVAGTMGMLLAIPITLCIETILLEIINLRKK